MSSGVDPTRRPVTVLSIAGSDSGGGAGIQADLKAFARCGVHGATAITAITAQNTVGVSAIAAIAPEIIIAQVRAVTEDIRIDAVKIGMLGDLATIEVVIEALAGIDAPVVLDPVMVAESGAPLLEPDAHCALSERLVRLATVVTPNVPEARALSGAAPDADPLELATAVHGLGARFVVVTGGHLDSAEDLFFDGHQATTITGPRHPDGAAHGSGCTHASVLAAQLALGRPPLEAARTARALAGDAVRDGLRGLGVGPGPVDVLAGLRR